MNGLAIAISTKPYLLIAAKHAEPEIAVVIVVALIGLVVIALIGAVSNTTTHVVIKRGLPHCPDCGRQVSPRRTWCRACVRDLTKDPATEFDDTLRQAEAHAEKQAEFARKQEELEEQERSDQLKGRISQKRREERRREKDEYWLERGIEPGPFAWWRSLPDWVRIIAVTLGIAVPIAIVVLKIAS
jgi:hypothetical protein